MQTLSIDIGGTGIKMLVLDREGIPTTARHRLLTPKPGAPEPVLDVIRQMIELQDPFDRVSVGFPGVVKRGVIHTAPNLGTEPWVGFDMASALADLTGKPARVVNDADLQGHGVIEGKGTEMVLTLGTGMGCSVFVDGRLLPNLELGHQPYDKKGRTYEERIGDAERKRIGNKRWNRRVETILAQLEPIWNFDRLHVGGGNLKKIRFELPPKVSTFVNEQGLRGGAMLWEV